ncbi:glycosyltransferase [Rhizobium sp. BK379]|jgi:glycosyltransferase involved in cell wall biosynthesis|uniref:glycosyltransferase family 2 protein n=1 Tax=Rhizobium sp. BK379 TaxID=2587059 RepID=UPI000367548B|nr:glycosyltransferase [Rhizobium sp. BK379]MBB3444210.1 hypothetical protein [Rhizobium sp. BK379]
MSKPEYPIEVSVVICTRNRHDQLEETLDSLTKLQSSFPWEAIILDNASTDRTKEVIKAFEEICPNAHYAYEAQRGLGAARDTAWRSTRGKIVAFTDDDCILPADYIDRVVEVFREDPELGFMGGRIELFDPDDAPVTIDLRDHRVEIPAKAYVSAGMLQGANMAIRRDVLVKIGGFDRRLGAGTPFPCEDIDAVAAAVWAGYRGAYDPRPVILHHHRRKAADVPDIMLSYDKGRGAYYMKYLLKTETRAAYIRGWWETSGPAHRPITWRRLGREIASARAFLAQTTNHSKKILWAGLLGLSEHFAKFAAELVRIVRFQKRVLP